MFPENLISIDAVFLEELKNKQTIKQTNTHKITVQPHLKQRSKLDISNTFNQVILGGA